MVLISRKTQSIYVCTEICWQSVLLLYPIVSCWYEIVLIMPEKKLVKLGG